MLLFLVIKMGRVKLVTQKEEFTTTELTAEERALFEEQFRDLFYPPWSLERQFITARKDFILDGIAVAKNKFDLSFGGFNAGANELGISPIRPGHVGLCKSSTSTAAEADNTWRWTSVTTAPGYTAGFDNWIHSPSSATTAFTVHEDSFIIPTHIVEESATPKLQCIKIDVGRTDILYYDVSACRIRDNATGINLIPLPRMYWGPNTDVLVAIQTKESGYVDLRLGGFTIAKGTFLDATVYEANGNTVKPRTNAST